MEKSNIQRAIEQLGEETVRKSITHAGISLGFCDLHGHYAFTGDAKCPLCPDANGTTATDVEHYIDVREAVGIDGTNPQQKL